MRLFRPDLKVALFGTKEKRDAMYERLRREQAARMAAGGHSQMTTRRIVVAIAIALAIASVAVQAVVHRNSAHASQENSSDARGAR
jgi:hypothetical protein